MKKDDVLKKNRVLLFFYFFIIAYLIYRYSPLSLLFNAFICTFTGGAFKEKLQNVCSVHNRSFFFIPIITIFSFLLYIILFRFYTLKKIILKTKTIRKIMFILLLSFICFFLLLHSKTHNTYIDELRDVSNFNTFRAHGIEPYLQCHARPDYYKQLFGVRESTALLSRSSLHPPFYYIFAASLSTFFKLPYKLYSYRALFMITFCTIFALIFLIYRKTGLPMTFLYFFLIIPFTHTTFRRFELLRCGTDFFAFIGFTTLMLILYMLYSKYLKITVFSVVLVFISVCVAFWSKFTTVVAIIALFSAALITVSFCKIAQTSKPNLMEYRGRLFLKLAGLTFLAFVFAIGTYCLAFRGTPMLKMQLHIFRDFWSTLPFMARQPGHPVMLFAALIPFQYSPLLVIGLAHGLFRLFKRFRLAHKINAFDLLVFLWLIIGMGGVVLANPKAVHTSVLTFGIIYIIWRGFELAEDRELSYQYLATCLLFACTEVLMARFA